ncbi:MAG: DNA-directed RNA polymerase subunit alpha C-terminal domain-containing protein [Planctomycetota bacterium]
MSEQTQTAPQTQASATDLLNQGQSDLSHLLRIRELVFSDEDQYEQLRGWLAKQDDASPTRGMGLWILGEHEQALRALEAHAAAPGVTAITSMALSALGRARDGLQRVAAPQTPDEGQAKAVALATLISTGNVTVVKDTGAKIREVLASPGVLADSPVLDFLRGVLHESEIEIDAAAEAYIACHERAPFLRENTFRLARLLELKGSDEEALELYEDYCGKGPANISVLLNLGILYEDNGEWRNAERCYSRALDLDPMNERARLYLGDVQASMIMHYDEEQERREDKRNAIMRMPVTDFELSVRSRNCLAKMGIRTLGDLVQKTEAELLSYKNFGETSLLEIQEILHSKNLRLGMTWEELQSESFGSKDGPEFDPNDPRSLPITTLELSVRSRRVIEQFRLRTIGDLCQKTEAELMACPNFGQTSLNEIKSKLDDLGLALKG